MRIVFVTDYHTIGMGYLDNCLPRALAAMGHDVHVVSSDLTLRANPGYEKVYGAFMKSPVEPCGTTTVEGYTLHRLPHRFLGHHVWIKGLVGKLREIRPDVIQLYAAAGVSVYLLSLARPFYRGRLYSACHQCGSILRPYLKDSSWSPRAALQRAVYFGTRTFPGWLVSGLMRKCFAATPDCADVAMSCYGVPREKIEVLPLGTDSDLFRPVETPEDEQARAELRRSHGFAPEEIVCIYTGRFTEAKKPLVLAKAVARLRESGRPFRGLFIGAGPQAEAIAACAGCVVLPLMAHSALPPYYRAADLACWPAQESMSMLDAAASGIPVVVSDLMGDMDRVEGNGATYAEGSDEDLARVLLGLADGGERHRLGDAGRAKVVTRLSWNALAEARVRSYTASAAS